MNRKLHIPDSPFDGNSPTLAVGDTRTLPSCVETRCRVARWVALASMVFSFLGFLSCIAIFEEPGDMVVWLFILVLLSSPCWVVCLASLLCHSRAGSLLLCISLPILFLPPLLLWYGGLVCLEDAGIAGGLAAGIAGGLAFLLAFALAAGMLLLYPLFRLGEQVLLRKRHACTH